MDGIKRLANKARQCGEGNIEDGKRPLNFELFLQFNKWFLEMGTYEGIYALAYSLATFNLACRGDSTLMICLKHLMWKGDATGVPFSHSKEEQLGDDPTKRLPRFCFGNPFIQAADFISGIFLYIATNPELIDNKDIFPMKYFHSSDVSFLGDSTRIRLKEVKQLMEIIDKTASENGAKPTKKMNMTSTNTCFLRGKVGLKIPTTTPTGRKRDIGRLKWSSAITYLPKASKKRRVD